MTLITYFCFFMLFLCVMAMGKDTVERIVFGEELTGRAWLVLVLFITILVLCVASMFFELATAIVECLKAWGLS